MTDPERGTSAELQWPALESNPEAMNKFLRSMGVPLPTQCCDVFGFDPELVAFLPQPIYAVLFCFPSYKTFDKVYQKVYADLVEKGATVPDDMIFMKQKISNACGTFSLIHALANNRHRIDLGTGTFADFIGGLTKCTPENASAYLAEHSAMKEAHSSCAQAGETDNTGEVDHHFICFTVNNDTLWEIDSRTPVPRNRGPCKESELMTKLADVVAEFTAVVEGNISFSAIALVGAGEA